VTHWAEYDYVLINRELEPSCGALRAILDAERLRRRRHPALNEFVQQFRTATD
jgi:guanylate kinase